MKVNGIAFLAILVNAVMCSAFAQTTDTFLITTSILAGAMIFTSKKK